MNRMQRVRHSTPGSNVIVRRLIWGQRKHNRPSPSKEPPERRVRHPALPSLGLDPANTRCFLPLDAQLRVAAQELSLKLFGYRVPSNFFGKLRLEGNVRPSTPHHVGRRIPGTAPAKGAPFAFDVRRGHFCARGGMTQCRPSFKTGTTTSALFVTRSGSYHLFTAAACQHEILPA